MGKKAIGAATALAAIALSGTSSPAQAPPGAGQTAQAGTTVHVHGVWRGVMFSRDRGFPRRGTTEVDVGFTRSTGGPTSTTSVGVGRTTITGHPSRNTWTYTATQEEYGYGVGALKIALKGRFTIEGKWVVDKAQGHVTEGAGLYAGVTGTMTSTGRNRVGARVITYKSEGIYTFPPAP